MTPDRRVLVPHAVLFFGLYLRFDCIFQCCIYIFIFVNFQEVLLFYIPQLVQAVRYDTVSFILLFFSQLWTFILFCF